ncbi:hypothetical protein FEI13_18205 [Halomonas urmiana]|uniref:Uncharacterized protein n=1 Tax=Halomonas urmiana TaxID=490901 RepID=A0A5R8M7F1_9GAMM|nr:hypothetical protein [Halomonas urmiana]TLF45425.1 hypothetical protein FEI13_18205 [Halomonas urmiana]
MHITNRTNLNLYWIAREAASDGGEPWQHLWNIGYELIHPGQTHDNNKKITSGAKEKGIFLGVGETKDAATKIKPAHSISVNWGAFVLILPREGITLTDWWSRKQRFINGGASLQNTRDDRVNIAEVSEQILSGISGALSAVPVAGDIISSAIGVISQLVGLGASPTPLPLTENQLENAIEKVIRKELKLAEASHASRLFHRAHKYITEMDELAASPSGLGPHELEDYHRNIEEYLSPQSDLNQSFDFLAEVENCDEALSICPAYMLGISAYVKMRLYHFLVAQMEGDPLAPDRLEKLKGEIVRFTPTLSMISDRSVLKVSSEMNEMYYCSDTIPEVGELRPAVYQHFLGLDSAEPVKRVMGRLMEIAELIEEDADNLRAGRSEDLHVFKKTWKHP